MGYSKVIYDGEILIDLIDDTVTEDTLLAGATAHNSNGDKITGTCDYDMKTSGFNATASNILEGMTAGVGGQKVTGTMTDRKSVTGIIKTKDEVYTIPQGCHDGGGKVSIDADEQAKLIAANIREGVTILGVEGSMSGNEDSKPQSKTVDAPLKDDLTVLPDSDDGYNCLTQVVVRKVPVERITNAVGKGITVKIG